MMNRLWIERAVLGAAVFLVATGCVLVNVETVQEMRPQGPPLNIALHAAYLNLANTEVASGDSIAASLFAYKARQAARGEFVAPEELADWRLPEASIGELTAARSRLMIGLAHTQKVRASTEAAHAQVLFDCWVESVEETAADVCSQYVLCEGVTVMGFKVASRVRGLSDEAFGEAFGTEEQCRAALVRLRWPVGFVCPCCGHREHCVLAGRGLYQCNRCKKQTSPTAGTIFHATKLPLTLWFAAIDLIVTAKNGISSVELGRRLGVKQPPAWAVKHKIMAVMARREGETALTGRVEMDDAYLGGVRSGGKRGRGAAGKTPFVAAVSTSPEGRPRKLKLAPVKGFRKREIARGAKHWLAPGAAVVTDGLGCWSALEEVACSHQAIRTGSGRQAARMASFKSVNTTLGNIKSAITGTYRKLGPDHAGRYLASFAWRYNPRYQLQTMIPRFVHSAARTQPMPYRLLIAG